MKNLPIVFFFLFFFHFSLSQNVEWSANLKFTDQAHLAFVNTAGEYIIAEGGSEWSFGQPSFFVLDESGNLVTEQFFDNVSFENGSIRDILELSNGDILILGSGGLCDVCCWGSMQRYDADWNPYWTDGEQFNMTTFPLKMDLDSAGLVYILYENQIIEFFDPETANVLASLTLEDKEYNDILASKPTPLVVGEGIQLISENLSYLEDYYFKQVEPLTETSFLTANDTAVYIINESFEIINHVSHANRTILDVSVDDSHIALLIQDNNEIWIALYDLFLADIDFFPIDISAGISPKAIALNDNQIFVTGTEDSENKSAFGKTYTLDGGTENFGTDVGISAIEFVTTPVAVDPPQGWSGNFVKVNDIRFTIKNNGFATVENFRINADFGSLEVICVFPQAFRQTVSGIQLNPGETITVTQETELQFWTSNVEDPFEFCFWTSTPNHKIDLDPSNDNICESVVINDTEEPVFENNLEILPNPAQLTLNIELPEGSNPELVQIFDVYGKLVFENKNEFNELNISNLNSGIYLIQIKDLKGIYSSKFMKM